ncbi:PHP domain-containing protein [Desulfosporosinus nitroreducens]|uniref:PHP domain-containing protein n=1 Tax=Desulfosporosinus nitroreducens TaxID=2018668 RepID=A0ABT8QKC4_9FIRM|nr:PHP domain-containing protein [Desulfosporosinus nitroreducens]MDO0821575.1 PHP domain-containing protein [Desulfosporosinus nitroreducens]
MTSPSILYEADLHCHTTESDGLLTPRELIHLAADLGLKGIGITDHDTIQGWREAEEAGAYYKIQVLRGIELNTDWQGKEVHILGYEVDNASCYLNDKLRSLRDAREQRMIEILKRLATQGISICADEVRKLTKGESIGRPHIAQVLIERGFVKNIKEAFERYIGLGAPAYVPHYKLTTEEGIELVRQAHGIPVLAHPGMQRLDEGIPAWVEVGLQGIEVLHSEHKSDDVSRYRAIAQQYKLLMTGGSDFHGEARKPGVELGRWGVPLRVLEQIQTLAKLN